MTSHLARLVVAAVATSLLAVGSVAGCSCSSSDTQGSGGAGFSNGTSTASHGANSGGASNSGGAGSFVGPGSGGGSPTDGLFVTPTALQTIDVNLGATTPTVKYKATFDGDPASAGWNVDRGDAATIDPGPASTATFAPTGNAGGVVTVTAGFKNKTANRQVFIKLKGSQNGVSLNPKEQQQTATMPGQLSAGGGVGGVGGEGIGGAASAGDQGALKNPMNDGSSKGLKFLYPYDKTVWPRGMLAPLLMWDWSVGDADAVRIDLSTTSGSFSWSGTFGRPPLATKFIRMPIPQDIWEIATNTAGSLGPDGKVDKLTVSLTVASGGHGYGPISETWIVAPAELTGTVYYNSYGTHLVKNWAASDGALKNGVPNSGNPVGAAILGVRSGDLAPTLVVGKDAMGFNAYGVPTDDSGCRVCHVVSSRGRWLLTQSENQLGAPDDGQTYLYDLQATDVQGSSVAIPQQDAFAWAALNGDATYALTNTINPSSTNPAIQNSAGNGATSSFWKFGAAPTAGTLSGLPAGVAAGYPSYSPDDKYVTYIDVTGDTANAQGPIMVANYDSATKDFSNVQKVFTSPGAGSFNGAVSKAGYPVFLPDNSGILFEHQIRHGAGGSGTDVVITTRNGSRSELWWLNLGNNPKGVALETLNGNSGGSPYIPLAANHHGVAGAATDVEDDYANDDATAMFDDTSLNYEPTILPIVAGGYAWVVFTSRRVYGNQLTSVPWQSWPPDYDTTDLGQATVKKLWVAAIDLSAPAGSDPSHPAFYLPAQEILAGNSRGFWVLDPCKQDGSSCETGDQCCNGFCEQGDAGTLVCSNKPPGGNCSGVQEKCTTAANCCDPTNQCINGFCAVKGVQ